MSWYDHQGHLLGGSDRALLSKPFLFLKGARPNAMLNIFLLKSKYINVKDAAGEYFSQLFIC
jgi:hypothetical protein